MKHALLGLMFVSASAFAIADYFVQLKGVVSSFDKDTVNVTIQKKSYKIPAGKVTFDKKTGVQTTLTMTGTDCMAVLQNKDLCKNDPSTAKKVDQKLEELSKK